MDEKEYKFWLIYIAFIVIMIYFFVWITEM